MNKEDFLKELEGRLKVLDHRERQDMLSEYSQHIDMKIQSGMGEKEAIEDFGDIDSLAQEILEAYHIDPDYRVLEEDEAVKLSKAKKAGNIFAKSKESLSGFLEQRKVQKEEKRSAEKKKQGKKFFHIRTTDPDSVEQKRERRGNPGRKKWYKEGWKFMKWVIGFCVKAALLFIAIPAVILDIIAVFGLGVLLILLVEGYPLIGVTIGVCGAVLCCSAYCLLVFSYIVGRKKSECGEGVRA